MYRNYLNDPGKTSAGLCKILSATACSSAVRKSAAMSSFGGVDELILNVTDFDLKFTILLC